MLTFLSQTWSTEVSQNKVELTIIRTTKSDFLMVKLSFDISTKMLNNFQKKIQVFHFVRNHKNALSGALYLHIV